ncbi:MAG: Cof-type HAD-IIB family hydrolase [Bifidobacterium aquikefiri]|uniref:Cof-type HAD-IIB family hydrolase n=1 Tax=Bifidobacterium aquikefiri TaxID=1653207 RepID=UPI0039EB2C5B
MNIRMIAMDLDGTLLKNDHRSISKASVRTIDAAHNNHIACTVATGRIFSIIPHQVRAISDIDWSVTSNGAVLYDNRLYDSKEPSLTDGTYVDIHGAERLLRNIPQSTWIEMWSCGKIYVGRRQWEHMDAYSLRPLHVQALLQIGKVVDDLQQLIDDKMPIEKINFPSIDKTAQEVVMKDLLDSRLYSFIPMREGLEVMGARVSKEHGIQRLCTALGIGLENVMAIGDSENDIEMLEACGMGIAMGNALDEVKDAADHVTLSNEDDGLALAIERYALN